MLAIDTPTTAGAAEAPVVPPTPVSPEEAEAIFVAKIETMQPGWRGLFRIMWWARSAGHCSAGLRLRAFLCSIYNGSGARQVDLSEIHGLDTERREWLCDVLLHMGDGSSGLYDYHIREAADACGVRAWFNNGFPRRRSRG